MARNGKNENFDGKAIRAARKKMHLSQVELAEGITTQATISLVENQNRVPNADVLLAILDRLNLDMSQFVSGDFLTNKAKELLSQVVLNMNTDALNEFKDFEKALSQNPPTLQAYYILKAADEFHNKQNYAQVIYNTERATDKKTPVLSNFFLFYAYHQMGSSYYLQGDVATAREKFALAYEQEPDLLTSSDLEFHGVLQGRKYYAEFLVAQQDYDEAASILSGALNALRHRVDLFWVPELSEQLANIEEKRGDAEAAKRYMHYARIAAYLSGRSNTEARLARLDTVVF